MMHVSCMCCLCAVPIVLKFCAELIETYGIVDGIYRLSGISSNIQRLRFAVSISLLDENQGMLLSAENATIMNNICLQCFDAVSWAAERASGL